MELIKKLFSIFIFASLLISCEDDDQDLISTTFYYPIEEYTINGTTLNSRDFNPSAIAVSNNKLYICNENKLEVFDLYTKTRIKTISTHKKNNVETPLNKLTSIAIHNDRIYIGSQESRLFILDQNTYEGINILGNGQWWNTFVHVFGVAVNDDYIFVKEKNSSIKVFKTVDVTAQSTWNPTPFAKLSTKTGGTENYSLTIHDGNLVIAGINTKAYLYYNINYITANASQSLQTPLEPRYTTFANSKPGAISINEQWTVTGEVDGNLNYLKIYPTNKFMFSIFEPIVNSTNVVNSANFGKIVSTAIFEDSVLFVDTNNKNIRVLKIKSASIREQ